MFISRLTGAVTFLNVVATFTIQPLSAQDMPGMPGMQHVHPTTMSGPLGISMNRMGSGTTWIPDAVPLPAAHKKLGSWDIMLHGLAFLQYDWQQGPRGDSQFGSLNWAMLMASRELAGGRFEARTMLSLDPLTVTKKGYPLLLQTGETFEGEPLHDFQHPHDFWMELAVLYEREITSTVAFQLYAAPSGEPALGPVAFMHRPSAFDDPVAPLGHHWMDATHISFGVVTFGLFTRHVKLEGSLFNGRSPDEDRWNIERMNLDSYSGRMTVNPDSQWSISVGYGLLKGPGQDGFEGNDRRLTLGITRGQKIGEAGKWASSIVVGSNQHDGESRWTTAALIESEAILDARNTLFGRVDFAQKSTEDLVIPSNGPGGVASGSVFDVASISLGYIREVGRALGGTIGLGMRGTINIVPAELETFYGSRMPLGALVFLRVRSVGG